MCLRRLQLQLLLHLLSRGCVQADWFVWRKEAKRSAMADARLAAMYNQMLAPAEWMAPPDT